ncbi:MAG: hypothetical protein ABIV92_07840, partial [Thermoflexales bacterium]
MDIGNILSRSINIVWRNKALWILGFLVALGSGGGGSGTNFNIPSGSGSGSGGSGIPGLPNLPRLSNEQVQGILVVVAALICVFFVLWIIVAVIGVIANGGLIVGADDADATGKMSFGSAFKRGSSRFWSLVGMRVVLWLPTLIVTIVVGLVVVVLFGATIASAVNNRSDRNTVTAVLASLGGLLCIAVPVGLLAFVYNIIASGIKVFGDRAIMLESTGAMDGIRRGWSMFKSRFGDIFLTGLILVVIGFVAGILFALVLGAIMAPGVILLLTQMNTQIQTVTWILL